MCDSLGLIKNYQRWGNCKGCPSGGYNRRRSNAGVKRQKGHDQVYKDWYETRPFVNTATHHKICEEAATLGVGKQR